MKGRLGELTPLFDSAAATLSPRYQLGVGDQTVTLNDCLGAGVMLTYRDGLTCIHCAQAVKKHYGGGYCYGCFSTLARCDLCVLAPERCHFDQGTCREPQWGEAFCMQPHVVYLSNTSGPKIGITRAERTWRRWIDQGASEALVIAHVPSRRAAGVIEAHFKRQLNDRTDWRKLVSGATRPADLTALATRLQRELPLFDALPGANLPQLEMAQSAWAEEFISWQIVYPVQAFSPAKRLNLSPSAPHITDNLQGVLGHYLLFTQGVVNLNDYKGVKLDVEFVDGFEARQLRPSGQLSFFD